MGMAPKTPNPEILNILERAESEIKAHQLQAKDKKQVLTSIRNLKRSLPWLSDHEEDILVMAMGAGFYWAESVPAPGRKRYALFDQTGKTKESLIPGQRGPGRPANKLIEIMSSLVRPSPPYSEEQCLSDIIRHYEHVKALIRRPRRGDDKIHYLDGKSVNLRSVRDQLVKKSKLSSKNPATE